jgi:hypothetical protein
MKFYGWRQGDWKQDENGPASKFAPSLKSKHRNELRRRAKKRTRQASKKDVSQWVILPNV